MNVKCVILVDVTCQDSTSSVSSLGYEVNTSDKEGKESLPELDLTLLWPYPQQLTLIKGSRYFPEAYLSVRILTQGQEGTTNIHS